MLDENKQAAKDLMATGLHFMYDPGEVQLIGCAQFGKSVMHMNVDEMRQVKEWIIHNHFRKTQVLQPEVHAELMKTDNDYLIWFRKIETKHDPSKSFYDKYQ